MATFTVTTLNDVVSSTDGQLSLREAVTAAEALPGTDTIAINSIALLNNPIVIRPGNNINFQGNGTSFTGFNGQGRTSLFLINNSTVTFNNLQINRGLAQGGNGSRGGGGGLGAGGGLFLNPGANVTANNVVFFDNRAVGGNSFAGRGDGGRGGNDSSAGSNGFPGGSGGLPSFFAIGGIVPSSGGSGGAGGIGGAAGAFAGVGRAGANGGNGRATFSGDSPGNGGVGGQGGGGAGLGGAVFVSNNATFNVRNSSFLFNSAVGGSGFQNGQGRGGAIFVQSGGLLRDMGGVSFIQNSASTANADSNIYPVKVNRGDRTIEVEGFQGVGRGSNPSLEVRETFDELIFTGEGLVAKNLLLTQTGDDLVVSFEGVDDTQVILKDFALENLDNLPISGGQHGQIGNIMFDGDETLQDSFDIFNADSTQNRIWNRNTVTFLNDLDNDVRGFNNSDDVINGQGGDDIIRGFSGDDILRGGEGNDSLYAGKGADILVGGLGNDTLYLGSDRHIDTVIYRQGDGSDVIHQFQRGAGGDLLQFEGIEAIDVVVHGRNTYFHLGDGVTGNTGFGSGDLLAELRGVRGFTLDNIGLNLASGNTAQFLFA